MLHPGIWNASDTATTRAIDSENKTDIKKFDIKLNYADLLGRSNSTVIWFNILLNIK